jgi:hypothetical protein
VILRVKREKPGNPHANQDTAREAGDCTGLPDTDHGRQYPISGSTTGRLITIADFAFPDGRVAVVPHDAR